MTRGALRVANSEKRNQKLRDAFYRRFTLLPRPNPRRLAGSTW